MAARPTGRLAQRDDGLYLLLDRLFSAPIEDVWYSLTNPHALEEWIGTYTGTPSTGAVKFRMTAEGEDAPWMYTSILECAPPHRLHLDIGEDDDKMRMFAHVKESGGMTTLTFGQRLNSKTDAALYGPGWDYYLDRLIAARNKHALPAFSDYDPVFTQYYRDLVVP